MHSSFLFLFIFCGFLSALQENLVAGEDNMAVQSSLITQLIRKKIDLTSKFYSSRTPLMLYMPGDETGLVNRTKNSIKMTILNDITVATITGGVLGNKVYQFYSYTFLWQPCKCSGFYDFKTEAVFFNAGYGSYEEALRHPDGIAIINVPITTSGNFSNPKFNQYSDFLQYEMKEPGSYAKIKSVYTYHWFVNFPYGGIYQTCEKFYRDPDTGKTTKAIVIILPSDPASNFISSEQFKVFLKLGDSMGKPCTTDSCTTNLETHKGIVVCNLLA